MQFTRARSSLSALHQLVDEVLVEEEVGDELVLVLARSVDDELADEKSH